MALRWRKCEVLIFDPADDHHVVRPSLLFFGSFAYEQPAYYMSKNAIDVMVKRNKRRQLLQRAGLGLLMLSFVLAGLSLLS